MSVGRPLPPEAGDPSGEHYDPELPFLEALEREVRRGALRAARRHEAGSRRETVRQHVSSRQSRLSATNGYAATDRHDDRTERARRGGRTPLQGASRIARRSLTLVALLCLIGASAFGASAILSGGPSNPTVVHQGPFALVASGDAGSDRWSLRLYRREADLCRVLVVAEVESSRCAPAPGAGAFAATSVVSPLRRYVFGVAGSEVARVTLRVGDATQSLATRAPNRTSARNADLPAGVRWFVAVLNRPTDGSDPAAFVRGLDTSGRPLGPIRTSCVETDEPQSCR
jgi:hypothetical protein